MFLYILYDDVKRRVLEQQNKTNWKKYETVGKANAFQREDTCGKLTNVPTSGGVNRGAHTYLLFTSVIETAISKARSQSLSHKRLTYYRETNNILCR